MDRRRIILISTAVAVLIGFSLYTFGLSPASPKAGTQIQPVKVASSTAKSNNNSTQRQNTENSTSTIAVPMNTYENRDKLENYYSIQFPQNATVQHGINPGSYLAKLPQGNAIFSSDLVDIPDTSNVQLYTLTQNEASLKSSLQQYHRLSFNQLTIGSSRAWELVYTWNNSTTPMESKKTFVEGADNAAALTFSAPRQTFEKISNPMMHPVMGSFKWLGK